MSVAAALISWLALVAIIMVGIASTGFIDFRLVPVPTPHYEYCAQEWSQRQLPFDIHAPFTDWCEQQPGR